LQEKKRKKSPKFFSRKTSVVFCKHLKKEKEDKTENKKIEKQAKLNYCTI